MCYSRKLRWGLIVLLLALILTTVLLVVFLRKSSELILVNAAAGSIQGARSSTGDFNVFLGIPYAKVNASNPFGASIPYPKFDSTFVANDDTKECPQSRNGVIDCLHLSVFVPDSASTRRLPVMVWIHGGGFETGSNRGFGAKYLVRHDMIVVAINYRLGPYGFMCLDIPEVPGNQGLKDQVLALRWVRDNIEAFGGDVNKINLFGQSAGGHSVDFHILSDTEVLYNNAILQSGSSLAATVFTNHPKKAPIDIAEQLGFRTSSLNEAIAYLSTVEPDLIIRTSRDLNFVYKPCTEKKFDGVEPFLTRHWVNVDTPKVKGMPILIGYAEQELLLSYINPSVFDNYNAIQNRLTQTFNFNDEQLTEMETIIRNFYFGDANITVDKMWEAIDFDSDYTYIYPTQRTVNKFLASEAKSIFYYVFAYNGLRNYVKVQLNVTIGSATHADEIGYLFEYPFLENNQAAEDLLVLDRMTTMWTNFAKFGDPTPEITSLLPVKWPSITNESYNFLTISSDMRVGRRPIQERMTFWDLFYKTNKQFEKGYFEE